MSRRDTGQRLAKLEQHPSHDTGGDVMGWVMGWKGGFVAVDGRIQFQPAVKDLGGVLNYLFCRSGEIPLVPWGDVTTSRRDDGQALADCIREAMGDE